MQVVWALPLLLPTIVRHYINYQISISRDECMQDDRDSAEKHRATVFLL